MACHVKRALTILYKTGAKRKLKNKLTISAKTKSQREFDFLKAFGSLSGFTQKHFMFLLNLFHLGGGGRGGGGGGKCPLRFQLSRTSLIFKQYQPNLATFTKILLGNKTLEGYHMLPWQPRFRHHVYSNFDFLNIFLH